MNSLWLNGIGENNFNGLSKNIKTDVCIIGAGIFGLTCGYYLSKAGLNVSILEKDEIGSKTTGHTTAKITSQHGIFYTYLVESFGEEFAKDYLSANQEAIENIKNIIDTEKINCDFERQSSFVYTTSSDEVPKLKHEVDVLNSLGFPANFVTKTGLPFDIAGAVQFKNQAQFNPYKYLVGLSNCILKYGGNIFTNTIVTDVKRIGDVFYVFTPAGVVTAKYVVLASHYPFVNFPGVYFFKMYQASSYVIGVDVKKTLNNGMYISASSPTFSFRTANYNGKKILLLGGCGHKTGSPSSYDSTYGVLESYAERLFPDCEVLFRWSTRDCITLDKVPYIGRFSGVWDNIFVGTGFNKWGMTSSNVGANIVSDLILGNDNEYAYVFDSTRVHPIKNRVEVKNMIAESVSSIAVKKFTASDVDFDSIPANSGGVIDVNNQKVGIFKDSSR